MDISKDEPAPLGMLNSVYVSELVKRGLGRQMASLEDITAEATVEALLENTLRSVQEALSSAAAVLSTDWLADSRLRDKLMFELRRVTNCQQL
eukprot:gene35054-44919_t